MRAAGAELTCYNWPRAAAGRRAASLADSVAERNAARRSRRAGGAFRAALLAVGPKQRSNGEARSVVRRNAFGAAGRRFRNAQRRKGRNERVQLGTTEPRVGVAWLHSRLSRREQRSNRSGRSVVRETRPAPPAAGFARAAAAGAERTCAATGMLRRSSRENIEVAHGAGTGSGRTVDSLVDTRRRAGTGGSVLLSGDTQSYAVLPIRLLLRLRRRHDRACVVGSGCCKPKATARNVSRSHLPPYRLPLGIFLSIFALRERSVAYLCSHSLFFSVPVVAPPPASIRPTGRGGGTPDRRDVPRAAAAAAHRPARRRGATAP